MWGSGGPVGSAGAHTRAITGVPATITADGSSDPIDISTEQQLLASVLIGIPVGDSTIRFRIEILDAIGTWLTVLFLPGDGPFTGAGYTYGPVGPGTSAPYVLTNRCRFAWVVGGSAPSVPGVKVALAGA
jgi:hypothetical protein